MSYKEKLIVELENSKCCEELIVAIKQCSEAEILNILKRIRSDYQNKFDDACRHIDCIDYLIYEMKKHLIK